MQRPVGVLMDASIGMFPVPRVCNYDYLLRTTSAVGGGGYPKILDVTLIHDLKG